MLQKNQAETETKNKLSYLALGDSYTIGEAVATEQNFPNQLVASLNAKGLFTNPSKIVAKTGWTTDELVGAIKSSGLKDKYDFVTLLIGVNNQYRGYDTAVYRKEFIQLLNTSINFTGKDASKVFVISIPDWGVTPFAKSNAKPASQITREIDFYNQINKEETEKLKANYIDITPISREAAQYPDLIAEDGLHPSALMYKKFVEKLSPLIINQLKLK